MVEYTLDIDKVFHSLADPTRRDMLQRICQAELSISELAIKYEMSLAAAAKHLKVMEAAKLITKRRRGKQQLVAVVPESIDEISDHLQQYKRLWKERYEKLDEILTENE